MITAHDRNTMAVILYWDGYENVPLAYVADEGLAKDIVIAARPRVLTWERWPDINE